MGKGETELRVGRPRANKKRPDGPVREEILVAARKLFGEQGFTRTSTRAIADLAGLKQPSLFHYFRTKDDIFKAVALGSVEPVMEFIAQEQKRNDPPEVSFFRLVHFDTYHLCTNENVLGSPFKFPELSRADQPGFWKLRDDIINYYKTLLKKGVELSVFHVPDVSIATHLLFGLGESTLAWFRDGGKLKPENVAMQTATLALRSVLADTSTLDDVIARAL